jgi:hypothetical protein
MSFVVYVDKANATGPKVHRESCPIYGNRKIGATTSEWYPPTPDYESAAKTALAHVKGSKEANLNPGCCSPGGS